MATLIIAEKNKAAKAIAEALGPVKAIKKSKGLQIYHIPSRNIYIIPLRGHILNYRNTEAFKSWTKSNPRDIITNPLSIKKFPNSYANPYISALKEYAKICNECIIGTDADIEGCNIGMFDALPFVKQTNNKISVTQIWLSSLQKNEIIKKFNNQIPPKYSWGQTGEARAILDATIGFSATRELTNTLKPLLKKFRRQFISIGRVQTSLLYLIYLREVDINNFIPEPYFTIEAELTNKYYGFKAFHTSNPFKENREQEAKAIYQNIKNETTAVIIKNTENEVKLRPPTPLNTSKALVLLTRNLKISAKLALDTMNQLYLNQIISYPRTDSDVYKDNFDHLQYLNKFSSHSQYGKFTSQLFKKKMLRPTKGTKDAGDHPPITPLESLELTNPKLENKIQSKVYNLLARHYLALFGKEALVSRNKLDLNIKKEPFTAKLEALLSQGFLEIAPFLKKKYDPQIQITNDSIPIENIVLSNKETQPPHHYSDTTLLKLMEKNSLGTKATRPIIINLLCDRELTKRENRQYKTTDLGFFLIDNLKEVWLPFLKPDFTSYIEGELEKVKNETKEMNDAIDTIKKKFLSLFDKYLEKKKEFIARSDLLKETIAEKQFPLSSSMCPFCKTHPMKLVTTHNKKRFFACSNEDCSKKYLNVPNKGKIQILDSKCSICGFNILKIGTYKYNKYYNYFMCPKCWSEGLKAKSGKGFCSNCENYKIEKNQCIGK
jgi:DNA topoisomerase-1